MKKLIAILLAAALILGLTGCDALNSEKKQVVEYLVTGNWVISLGQGISQTRYIFTEDGKCTTEQYSPRGYAASSTPIRMEYTYEIDTGEDLITLYLSQTEIPSMIFRYTLEEDHFSIGMDLGLLTERRGSAQ